MKIKMIMKKYNRFFLIPLSYLIFIISFYSCSSSNIENLSFTKEKIRNYYESGKYDKEASAVINKAIDEINKLNILNNSNAVVIFDVDETALDNYPHLKEVDYGYIKLLWDEWLMSGKSKAIQQVKEFYDFLISKKIKVIFITGRDNEFYDATHKNLKQAGYIIFDTLITRSDFYKHKKALEYKSKMREELVNKGYNIIANIGDQWSDLEDGYSGIKIKLPNYLYYIE